MHIGGLYRVLDTHTGLIKTLGALPNMGQNSRFVLVPDETPPKEDVNDDLIAGVADGEDGLRCGN